MDNQISKLADAIINDVRSGLQGIHHNSSISKEQLMDDIVDERLIILKEYSLKGILPLKDLYISINCIKIDCDTTLERCGCGNDNSDCSTYQAHFEIPQIVNDYGAASINYIGSTDRQNSFVWYTSPESFRYHQYRKRGKNKPYVWIDTTPNKNNMYDCFLFNAPLVTEISISAIFKDIRQLDKYGCCQENDNVTFINNEIKKRLTEKKLRYYRYLASPVIPNTQQYTA